MKVLVTGVKGQLGYDVVRELEKRNIEAIGCDMGEFDLTDREQTVNFIVNAKPDAVVHCAAYTAVDRAEDDREVCYKVNVLGTRYVREAAEKIGAKLAYFSTDYVFGGEGNTAWKTTDKPDPVNYYGETKYLGEKEVLVYPKSFVFRISWVFGINGKNFIKTMLRLGGEKPSLTVVSDQIGSPTYTYDLAKLVVDAIFTDKYGVYHATNEGYCSWYEFATEIMKEAGLPCKITPVTSDGYPTRARRPHNSRMDKSALTDNGFALLPPWQDALKRYLTEIKENGTN